MKVRFLIGVTGAGAAAFQPGATGAIERDGNGDLRRAAGAQSWFRGAAFLRAGRHLHHFSI
ncbi:MULTISPECIES: hypothetical protein [Bacteria]|jgi:hypothetical protein|uniref:hypothetical protein n=1 Tax=Bacteria TaxID=2 RepID=UPI000AF75670|nr:MULTISPECIES: hypothetical protein [Bacteria]